MRRLLISLFLFALPARALAEAFPDKLLFKPLAADPRWPWFSVAMVRIHEGEHGYLARADGGESFPLVGGDDWQFGMHAGVFSLWDMSTETDEMVNADFLVGLPYTRRWGKLTAMFRVYHVSTHLGDEYMLSHPWVERLNLSYEALDARASYDLGKGLRVYGGGGYLYRRYPSDLKPGQLQLGGEWEGKPGKVTPYAAVDLQKREDNGWGRTDVSARLGTRFTRPDGTRGVAIYAEYYKGHNPNGQWFRQKYETLGAGLQLRL